MSRIAEKGIGQMTMEFNARGAQKTVGQVCSSCPTNSATIESTDEGPVGLKGRKS